MVSETVQKMEGEAAAAKDPQEPLNPSTHKGTWASMFRK